MRLRFTIRDLLWLTVVGAICAAWWIDRVRHEQTQRDNATLRMNVDMLESQLRRTRDDYSRQLSDSWRQQLSDSWHQIEQKQELIDQQTREGTK